MQCIAPPAIHLPSLRVFVQYLLTGLPRWSPKPKYIPVHLLHLANKALGLMRECPDLARRRFQYFRKMDDRRGNRVGGGAGGGGEKSVRDRMIDGPGAEGACSVDTSQDFRISEG